MLWSPGGATEFRCCGIVIGRLMRERLIPPPLRGGCENRLSHGFRCAPPVATVFGPSGARLWVASPIWFRRAVVDGELRRLRRRKAPARIHHAPQKSVPAPVRRPHNSRIRGREGAVPCALKAPLIMEPCRGCNLRAQAREVGRGDEAGPMAAVTSRLARMMTDPHAKRRAHDSRPELWSSDPPAAQWNRVGNHPFGPRLPLFHSLALRGLEWQEMNKSTRAGALRG